jgi:hypothetical protein
MSIFVGNLSHEAPQDDLAQASAKRNPVKTEAPPIGVGGTEESFLDGTKFSNCTVISVIL